jgi:hypothetical protein
VSAAGFKSYQCHKRVKAAQIVEVLGCCSGAYGLVLDGDQHVVQDSPRYAPQPGDYLVEYEPDGYRSISPKHVFEDGYRELPSEDELCQAVAFAIQGQVRDANVKPIAKGGAVVSVEVTVNGTTITKDAPEPLTDEVACLMFGCKAGIQIADAMNGGAV